MADNVIKQDKLHWVVKHRTSFKDEEDFLETILMDCGVKLEDIPKFLNPNRSMIHDPFLMKNMKEAVELIHKHVMNGNKIAMLQDPDCDGISSFSLMYQFLMNDVPYDIVDIIQLHHFDKKHGLMYDTIKDYKQNDLNLIIVPDASTTMKDILLIKKNFPNIDIVILDHHNIEIEFYDNETGKWISEKEAKEIKLKEKERIQEDCYINYTITVNCHDGQYPNSDLSGVGVCQKFIEAWLELYPNECDDNCKVKYLDLVSLGLICDAMSAINLENRYYMTEGLKKYCQNNELIKEIEDRHKEDMAFGRTITNIGWVIGPKINGVLRYGKDKEQIDLCKAMMGIQEDVEYTPKRKNKNDPKPDVEIHSLQKTMARVCDNVKARQDTSVRKFVTEIEEDIQKNNLDENSVIFVDGTKVLEKGTVSGLVCNKIASKYFRPVVLMREFDSTTFGGSGRGYSQSNIRNLNELLSSVGVTCMGQLSRPDTPFHFHQVGI